MKKMTLALAALSALALSACGIPISEECTKYVECAAHYDEVNDTTTDTSAYDADGACWTNAESAESCTTGCVAGTDGLRGALEAAEADVGACAE